MQSPPSIINEEYRALLQQLTALRLPPLKGKRFLEVNCGDGFFCGYAEFNGAAEVVGLDNSETALALAESNFPDCDFRHTSLEALPERSFDVILFASASYHTRGIGPVIHQLMRKLAIDGTLVIEIGVVDVKENFAKVRDGEKEFVLLSRNTLGTILDRYAWKSIGHRPLLPGIQVAQHVIHIRNMSPYAFLLLEPPASGKSTVQRVAFRKPGVRLVSGDQVLLDIFNSNISTSPRLEELVKCHFISTSIARLTKLIFTNGLGPDLIQTWCEQAGGRHFVLDSYLHKKFHPQLQTHLRALGFVPVTLSWSLDSGIPLPKQTIAAAESYRAHLMEVMDIADPGKLPAMEYHNINTSSSETSGRFFSRLRKAISSINK